MQRRSPAVDDARGSAVDGESIVLDAVHPHAIPAGTLVYKSEESTSSSEISACFVGNGGSILNSAPARPVSRF